MRKKILALALALSSLAATPAFAAKIEVDAQSNDTKAIVMCYDENGKLVYSNLYKKSSEDFDIEVPQQYDGMKKKVYFVDTKRFGEAKEISFTPTPTDAPVATDAPISTPKPTSKPSSLPSIYEKEVDAVRAFGVVTEVDLRTKEDGTDIYGVTMLYQGRELTVGIEADLKIATAPAAYADVIGKEMDVLEAGDVIVLEANIAGDRINNVDFIFRPTQEDIVTGTEDYGTNFEKLFVSDGKVAGKWTALKYGEKPSNDRYQYAFGIIGKKDSSSFTLINLAGSEDDAIEISTQSDTIVYTCDVNAKEYVLEIGDESDILTTIPKKAYNDTGSAELTADYSYNYALVRLVDDIATDVVVYNNYND